MGADQQRPYGMTSSEIKQEKLAKQLRNAVEKNDEFYTLCGGVWSLVLVAAFLSFLTIVGCFVFLIVDVSSLTEILTYFLCDILQVRQVPPFHLKRSTVDIIWVMHGFV